MNPGFYMIYTIYSTNLKFLLGVPYNNIGSVSW